MNLTRIELYGHLRKRFGRRFMLAVGSVSEAIRALDSQLPGFGAWVSSHGSYKVLVGAEAQTLDTLENPVGGGEVIKIVPVVAGASDAVQIIVGAALIAAGVFTGQGWLVSTGVAMALGGVATMLAAAPRIGATSQNGPSDMPSYSFGSPTVTIGQGRPVPVLYGGPLRIGGAIVSAGIVSEGYQSKGFGGAAFDDAGTWSGNGDSIPWSAAIAPA
jgi:predicted phage tail protein